MSWQYLVSRFAGAIPEKVVHVLTDVDGTIFPLDAGIKALHLPVPHLGYKPPLGAAEFYSKFQERIAEIKREGYTPETSEYWEAPPIRGATPDRVNTSQIFVDMLQEARRDGTFPGLNNAVFRYIGKQLEPYEGFKEGVKQLAQELFTETGAVLNLHLVSCGLHQVMSGTFGDLNNHPITVNITGQKIRRDPNMKQRALDSASKEIYARGVEKRGMWPSAVVGFGDGPTDLNLLLFAHGHGGHAYVVHEDTPEARADAMAHWNVFNGYAQQLNGVRPGFDGGRVIPLPIVADWCANGAARNAMHTHVMNAGREMSQLHGAAHQHVARFSETLALPALQLTGPSS